ncbi:efflux RND transporter periplasmic adaptor subunit [Vannielia sp. SX4]|uniref:efflux RND transporter periplasmic adaptor subunit n=1 Tax=Vannielia sp. SX4 TaxID=3463852 RepID=UPI00405A106C
MNFLRRSLVGLFLLSVTLGLLAVAGASFWGAVEERMNREAGSRPARERVAGVNVVVLEPGRAVPVMTAFGEVLSERTLDIRAAVGGRIVELSEAFTEGGSVEAGELLARIDPVNAEAALDNARTDVAEAEAELADAERALVLARDDQAAAERQAELRAQALVRQESLRERGVGSAAAVEEAQLAAASADQAVLSKRQAVASAQSRVDVGRNGVSRANIALANAERDLADHEIRASFSGTLADVAVVEGGLVAANELMASLIDPDALEVSFRLSTAQYARLLGEDGRLIPAAMQVRLDVSGLDLVAEGRLDRVSGAVGEGQTGRVIYADLTESAGFRPGDFVTVSIEEPALEGVAVVPATAVDAAGTVLVLNAEERLELAQVEVLRRQGDEIIIRAEGHAGALIVAERSPLVGPGIRARALGDAAPAAAPAEPTREELVELSPERRAKLIAFIEGNNRMPAEAKERVLAQLSQDRVPAETVERIESRMGG